VPNKQHLYVEYGWMPHNSGFGFLDRPRAILGQIHFFRPVLSSCHTLPCYATLRNRNILDFMRWPHIGLGAQDRNDIQRPKYFQKIAGSEVLDEYYNSYLRK
jgi:hypothetical protein